MSDIFQRRTADEILQSQEIQWKIRLLEYIIPRVDGDLREKEIIAEMVVEATLEAQIEDMRLAANLLDGIAKYAERRSQPALYSASKAISGFADMKAGSRPIPEKSEEKS